MQLSAEETLYCKPANYTNVAAAAAGFKVVCVLVCLIAFVYACVPMYEVLICVCFSGAILHTMSVLVQPYTNAHVHMSKSVLVFISMLCW